MRTRTAIIAAAVLLVIGIVVWVSLPAGRVYRATAMVLVERAELGGPQIPGKPLPAEADLNRAVFDEELRIIAETAAKSLGAGEYYEAKLIPKTHLIEITVYGPDAVGAAERCNRIADAYKATPRNLVRRQIVQKADVPRVPFR